MKIKDRVLGFSWQGRNALVTGASGFVGSWLSRVLLELGANVYGATTKPADPLSAFNLLGLKEHLIQVNIDITNYQQVLDTLNAISPQVIFHLAAMAIVPEARRDPRRAFDVNIMGTINILEGCRQLGIGEKLLISSTDHVFGHQAIGQESSQTGNTLFHGFDENAFVSYGEPYGTSKSALELCARCYHSTYWHEMPDIGITRAANVFGYGDVGPRRVIPLFVTSALNEETGHVIELKYRMNGRQFVHITDVIAGYIRAASVLKGGDLEETQKASERTERVSSFTPTFHFAIEKYEGTEEPFIRMKQLGELVARIFSDKGARLVEAEGCKDYADNENQILGLNCDQTREKLRWKPYTELESGIRSLREWYSHTDDPKHLRELIELDVGRTVDAVLRR